METEYTLLPDPIGDRVVKELQPPPHKSLTKKQLYPKDDNIPNWALLKDFLSREGRLNKVELINILSTVTEILKKEPNLIKVMDPVTLVGDIHGQFYDLLKILEVGGAPDQSKYLFMGDYVDRGSFSIEVCLLLFALKINYPENYIVLRGNHECRQITSHFNFHNECLIKYDEEVYNRFMDAFDALPLTAIVNNKFFVVHGGISPYITDLKALLEVNRFEEIPSKGPLCDLMWSDPIELETEAPHSSWEENLKRGCSYSFGGKALLPYLKSNNFVSLIRAHEVQMEGFKMYKWNKKIDFPSCITLFSAANYCDVYGNKGAIIKFKSNNFNLVQFNCSIHPFILPDYQSLISWSLPFISEKSKNLFIIV